MRVAGLIAAAGRSSRIGVPKALLPFRSAATRGARTGTFVARIAEVLVAARLDPVVVTMPQDEAVAARMARELAHLPVLLVPNHAPTEQLSGSVTTALLHAPDAEALVLTPVDCPFLDVALVQALLRALPAGAAAAPVVDGVRGHPVVFARPAFELLWSAGGRGGPRAVLDALGGDVIEVPWTDPRVCDDVDTAEDYERLFGRRLSSRRQP